MLFQLLFDNPLVFVFVALALVASISIHEFAHAYVADKLGDGTARALGRVTLNPLAHLDPIGTLLLLFAGFGWGRPVPFNPYNLQNPKRDGALIALAGPVSNFVLAILLSLIFRVLPLTPATAVFGLFIYLTVTYNIILGVFNLIPIHPLDGFKIVNGVLPPHLSLQWQQTAQFGVFILLFLVITRTTGMLIDPVINFFLTILGFPVL